MGELEVKIARVETRVDGLESALTEIRADVKSILAIINQGRGAMWMGGLIGTVGGPVVMKLLTKAGLM